MMHQDLSLWDALAAEGQIRVQGANYLAVPSREWKSRADSDITEKTENSNPNGLFDCDSKSMQSTAGGSSHSGFTLTAASSCETC